MAALNDKRLPTSSDDQSIPRHTFWPRRGTKEWLQYEFDKPREAVSVDPDNPIILANHVKCSVFELPFDAGEGFGQAEGVGDVLDFIRSATDGSAPKPGPMALQVPAEFGGNPLVTPAFIDHAHAHGIVVHVWTINEIDEMESLLDLGVDGLVTDYPGRMRDVVERRA